MAIYREQSPAAALSRWVECAWISDSTGGETRHRVPPDGCLDIVYDRAQGLRAVGAMTAEQNFHFPQGACLTGIRFRPGMARAFLGVCSAELTDISVSLDDLWTRRARQLRRQLDDAAAIQDAMRVLLAHLPAPASPSPMQLALEAIAATHGNADLDEIARQANLSPRQFRRRCLEESGLPPKLLCRVLRFRNACRIARERGLSWSAVAAEAEYFDQSHLIRDFREFTGQSPMAVLSNTDAAAPG